MARAPCYAIVGTRVACSNPARFVRSLLFPPKPFCLHERQWSTPAILGVVRRSSTRTLWTVGISVAALAAAMPATARAAPAAGGCTPEPKLVYCNGAAVLRVGSWVAHYKRVECRFNKKTNTLAQVWKPRLFQLNVTFSGPARRQAVLSMLLALDPRTARYVLAKDTLKVRTTNGQRAGLFSGKGGVGGKTVTVSGSFTCK
jgi:hypothetical protein